MDKKRWYLCKVNAYKDRYFTGFLSTHLGEIVSTFRPYQRSLSYAASGPMLHFPRISTTILKNYYFTNITLINLIFINLNI